MVKGKITIDDALNFVETHSEKVDGIVKLITEKHYDKAKRIFSRLSPQMRRSFILLLQDSEKKRS